MKIQPNSRVELEYTIHGPDGDVLESSEDKGLLAYVQGSGELPARLEEALDGADVGGEAEVAFAPGEAFGDYSVDGIIAVPRADFPELPEPGEWVSLNVEGGKGAEAEIEMRVVEIGAESVVLDANHPLAEVPVTFRVRVVSVEAE